MIDLTRLWTEQERLAALESYAILDTPHEQEFDDVVKLLSDSLNVPIAAVNLIAKTRQWFKAEVGLGVREMPLDDSICKHALLTEGPMIVPDTRNDPRFSCNPLVTGNPALRFYAGEQLRTPDGVPLGTLCALDYHARPGGLSEHQAFLLKTLARQIMSQLELRRVLRQQQELLTKQARAQQSLQDADQRKNEFLATLAHELRNPLAPITSAATVLSITDDPAMVRKAGEVISRQARHMTGLIDDLLDVSRVGQGKVSLERVALDMRAIVDAAVEQVSPLIDMHHHKLSLTLPAEPALVLGDRKRLIQVLANLLSNAAKYSPDAGSIDVGIESDSDYIIVSVKDSGLGMTPEILENCFDMFAQASTSLARSHGGLGIGLALVKNLVGLHNGIVKAESRGPDQGSLFTVRLPRVAELPTTQQCSRSVIAR